LLSRFFAAAAAAAQEPRVSVAPFEPAALDALLNEMSFSPVPWFCICKFPRQVRVKPVPAHGRAVTAQKYLIHH